MGLFSHDTPKVSLRVNAEVQRRNERTRRQEAAAPRRRAQRKAHAVREARRIGRQAQRGPWNN